MAIHQKKIEFFTLDLFTENDFSVLDILTSEDVVENEVRVKGKTVSYRLLQNSKDYLVGLVETSRNENIPPKKNKKSKKIGPLGLTEDEGLAYANIFLFEKKRNILLYEVNKFGCYVNHFVEFVYKSCRNSDTLSEFNLVLNPILQADQYRRMLNMSFHKSVEFQIANPSQIVQDYRHKNDAIFNVCSSAAQVRSERVIAKFEVAANGESSGLSVTPLRRIIDRVLEIAGSPNGNNVQKLIVVGYETDSDEEGLVPIDMIADRLLKHIDLDEPRENSDLLEQQRKSEIVNLYKNCIDEFNAIFGK